MTLLWRSLYTTSELVSFIKEHVLVYTPPWVPEVQPSELIWEQVKGDVARQFSYTRTIQQTRQQTELAFESINSQSAKRVIGHCHEWIDSFISDADRSLSLHQFSTLAKIIENPVAAVAILL